MVAPREAQHARENGHLVTRLFRPNRPNEPWVAGITQHATRVDWVYCAVVNDAYSYLVVGPATWDDLPTELAIDFANSRRRPVHGTTSHSEHGS